MDKEKFDWLMENNHNLRTELKQSKQKVEEAEKKLRESYGSKEHEKKERENAQHYLVQGIKVTDQYKNDLALANKEIENLKLLLEAKEEELKKSRDKNENFTGYIRKANKEIRNQKLLLEAKEEELKKSKDKNEKLEAYMRKIQSKQCTNESLQSESNITSKPKEGDDEPVLFSKKDGTLNVGSSDKTKASPVKDINSNVGINSCQIMDKTTSDIENKPKASSTVTKCTTQTINIERKLIQTLNEKMKNKSQEVINEVQASDDTTNRKKTLENTDLNEKMKNKPREINELIEKKQVRASVDSVSRQKSSLALDSNKKMENKSREDINEFNVRKLAQASDSVNNQKASSNRDSNKKMENKSRERMLAEDCTDSENIQKASKTRDTNENLQNSRLVVNDHHPRDDGKTPVASVITPEASSTNVLKTPLDQKKRLSNYNESPSEQKSGKRTDGKRKYKERFETAFAPMEETPLDIKRRKKKVEMARIQTDVLKKDAPFFGSESESEEDMEGKVLYCLKCPKSFNSNKLLRQHIEIHVNTKVGEEREVLPLFKCSLCDHDRVFHNAAGIFAHIESRHTAQNDSVMNCAFRNCFHQVKVAKKLDLLSHIRSKHTEEKLFKCEMCRKDFSTYTALRDHEKKHTSGKQCRNCLRFYTLEKCHYCFKKT